MADNEQFSLLTIRVSALELQRNNASNEAAHYLSLAQHANNQLTTAQERIKVLEAEVATKQDRIGALEIELKAMNTPSSAPPAVPEAPQSPPEHPGVMVAGMQE